MNIDDYANKLNESDKEIFFNAWEDLKSILSFEFKEVISYGIPTIKYQNKSLISLAIWKNFYSIYPNSGSVIGNLPQSMLNEYKHTKAAINIPKDQFIPLNVVEQLIKIRIEEIA